MAVLQDVSQSAGPNGIATIQPDELRELVQAVMARGGEAVFGVIGRRDEALVRLRVRGPDTLNAYQGNSARLQARKEVERFLALVETRLRAAPSQVTDLTAALHRVNRFFEERGRGGREGPHHARRGRC